MSEKLPNIFLSSTFYDLRQVRADIADFVERDLGYRLIASEHHTFPVEPTIDAIENCRRRVEADADVLVLVVGGRYGSVPPGGLKSVTNIEYSTARAKGIPIYAFINRDVLAILPLFERDPDGEFAPLVDTPKLLSFVVELRKSGIWTFQFDLAKDIVEILRVQLAYQMARGLVFSSRMHQALPEVRGLAARAFQLAIEQSGGWEARLFAQVLADEIEAAEPLRMAHDAGVVTGIGERVDDAVTSSWLLSFTEEAKRLIAAMENTAHSTINRGFTQSDITAIIYGARQIGALYREGFEWAARLRRAHVHEDWRRAVEELSIMLDDFLVECREFSKRTAAEVERALSNDVPQLHLTFNFHVGENPRFQAELEKIRRKRGWQ